MLTFEIDLIQDHCEGPQPPAGKLPRLPEDNRADLESVIVVDQELFQSGRGG